MVKKVITRYRSAETGHFVKENYAKRFPEKTIKDNMPRKPNKK